MKKKSLIENKRKEEHILIENPKDTTYW